MKGLLTGLLALFLLGSPPRATAQPCDCQCPPAASEPTPAPLDLNAASLAQLEELPRIGPAKARAIADYRDKHRGFRHVAELLRVKGIGRALFREIRERVAVAPRE